MRRKALKTRGALPDDEAALMKTLHPRAAAKEIPTQPTTSCVLIGELEAPRKKGDAMRHHVTVVTFVSALMLSISASAQVQADYIMTSHACNAGGSPAANEVYIYTNINFSGTCSALAEGFYPSPSHFGLPDNSIKSLKTGANVRAKLFWDTVYGGQFGLYSYGTGFFDLGGFKNQTSSIRVMTASRHPACSDLQPGEFAVFRNTNFLDDCVVLRYTRSYPTPSHMGIANDSISSISGGPQFLYFSGNSTCNGRPWRAYLYRDANLAGPSANIISGNNHGSLGFFSDVTSSITTGVECPVP